jgi:hypothetical protein
VDKERSELTARRTALELEVKEIQEGVATDGEAQSTLAAGNILSSHSLILHFMMKSAVLYAVVIASHRLTS